MQIYCICGMGLGSSLIAKMNVEKILQEEGIEASVYNCDLGSIASVRGDYYITTRELANNMPEDLKPCTIVLSNFIDVESIREKVLAAIVTK